MSSFDALWAELEPIGRTASGGYRRYAWSPEDRTLREWFAGAASARGFDVVLDRAGNQWAWRGDPDETTGVVLGSHLDSVPDGGAFDGPLGVVSAFIALDALDAQGFEPSRPIGVVNFGDEEGARFGVACAGSRVLTGALDAGRARSLVDTDAISLGEAMATAGGDVNALGRDDEALRRVGAFLELHVEQGRALADLDRAIAVGTAIRPHGRWRVSFAGEANHAGTTPMADRHDAMVAAAQFVLAARDAAVRHGAVATCGKLQVVPNGVNAIPSAVDVWLDVRASHTDRAEATVADLTATAAALGATIANESWTGATGFDVPLGDRLARLLDDAPLLDTGAGHDAGVLAAAGVPTAMLFVRNPTGVSHSPAEHADRDDCLAGVGALATVITELAG